MSIRHNRQTTVACLPFPDVSKTQQTNNPGVSRDSEASDKGLSSCSAKPPFQADIFCVVNQACQLLSMLRELGFWFFSNWIIIISLLRYDRYKNENTWHNTTEQNKNYISDHILSLRSSLSSCMAKQTNILLISFCIHILQFWKMHRLI